MISYPWDSIVEAIGDDGFPIYDRDYKAADLQSLNGRIFSNGVFMDEPDAFVVTPAEGMNVILSTGWCCINGTFGNEPNMRELAIQSSASTQDRIDTVVLRWNANIEMRNIDVYVKTGVASDVPVRPTLTRDSTVYELGIADIFVPRGSGAISAARITDTRLQTDRCGAVTPFMQIDTTTFYNQIQAAIDDKIANIDELADFTYLKGGFYAVHVDDDDGHLYAYYDEADNPPPLSLNGGRLYYTVNDDNVLDLGRVNAMPAGTVVPYAGEDVPDGWLECNGNAISREEYALLFSAIGVTYGAGDGSTTFNLPDARGRFALGYSSGYAVGSVGGEYNHTLSVEEIPSHNHSVNTAAGGVGNDGTIAQRGWQSSTTIKPAITFNTGGSNPHNNMPPYITMKYIISTGR